MVFVIFIMIQIKTDVEVQGDFIRFLIDQRQKLRLELSWKLWLGVGTSARVYVCQGVKRDKAKQSIKGR